MQSIEVGITSLQRGAGNAVVELYAPPIAVARVGCLSSSLC